MVFFSRRSREQGPSETAFFDILVKIYECWINGSSYPEYALLQDRSPFRTHKGLRQEKFRTLDWVLDMNFSLVVNLRWREIQIFRVPELLGWDWLLPIVCVNIKWKFAFPCLQQAWERNFFTSFSCNRWEVINPSPVVPGTWKFEFPSTWDLPPSWNLVPEGPLNP